MWVAGFAVALSVAVSGCSTSPVAVDAPDATTAPHGDLSNQEYAAAVELAQQEIRADGATIPSATVTVGSGSVQDPNLDGRCDSGRVLRIKLIGTFPTIVTTGHPASQPRDFTVHAVLLTVDAESGDACEKGVQAGDVSPEPGSVVLDLAEHRATPSLRRFVRAQCTG